MKIRRVGAELFHTDRQTDMTKLIVVFRNFETPPPPLKIITKTVCIFSIYIAMYNSNNTWLVSDVILYTRCGNKETALLLLLISGHLDDEEEGRALTRGLPSTVTQRFIHAHRLVWP